MSALPPDIATPASIHLSMLRRSGYTVIRSAISPALREAVQSDLTPHFDRTPPCQGDFYGWRTKRFHGLLKRSWHARDLVLHPLILAIAEEVLLPFCDNLQLNLTQAVEIQTGEVAQVPHRDEDMWPGVKGSSEYLLNVMWPLSPFTAENGATLIWPRSHLTRDASGTPVAVTMEPGDALLFLGSTLHGAGPNRTTMGRRGAIVSYCLGWLKPYENQWLTYPPAIARDFPPALAALAGYRLHRPNLGNYEGQCPSLLLSGSAADHQAAVDHLLPAQKRAMRGYRRSQ